MDALSLHAPILVRGAVCELGRALCARLAGHGVAVLGTGHETRPDGEFPSPLVFPESPEEMAETAREKLGGRIGGYVDLAQTRVEGLFPSFAPGKLDAWAHEDIALRARALRAVSRIMLENRSGRCLFVSSLAVTAPAPGQALYGAAKACGEALFASLGLELAARGITSASLRLGLLDVGRGASLIAGKEEEYARLQPSGALMRVDDAVDCLLYLLSKSASAINATALTLDGGASRAKAAWLARKTMGG